jgi:PAS domain S-box-containing protein
MTELFKKIPGLRSSIGRKFIFYILLFSSVITFMGTGLQLYLDYDRDLKSIHATIEQVKSSYLNSITNCLWVTDAELLWIQLDGILRLPDMQFIEVRKGANVLEAVGTPQSESIIEQTIPLVYIYNGQDVHLGELHVVASLKGVYQRIIDRVLVILGIQAVKTFLVCLFIFIIFYLLVGKHIIHMASFFESIRFESMDQPLRLDRKSKTKKPDELDQLAASFNRMRENLAQDIIRRETAEKELQESALLFSQMFEQSTTSMGLYKPGGTILRVNNEFCKMFGVEEKVIMDSGYNVFKDQAAIDAGVIPLLREIFDEKKSRTWRIHFDIDVASASTGTNTSKTGKIFIEVFGYPVVNRKGDLEYVVLQHYDLTARERAEEEKAKLESELQQSQKMEAVGTLAGGIAHDFNNILAVILGNAELAADDVPRENPASKSLKAIHQASIRAKDMVRQLLAFSRKSDEETKLLNMTPIIKESMKMLRTAVPSSVEFKQHISDDPCNILGDAAQINQIMMNLVTNASHAMSEEGGLLDVTLEKIILPEEKPCFDWILSPGPHIRLKVRDTGEGISPRIMARIFDPYYTTKEVGKGTGMGLSVVHGIVKSHGGGILVESTLGEGTVFEVYFPALEKTIEKEKEPDGEIKGGSERILFVDDEESMVNLNRQRLERLGYQVKSTTKPLEALEWFKAEPDQFDVVITDMTMPRMTGDRLTKEILAIRPEMLVIICTGYSERMSAKEAEALGARKYIEKPMDTRNLASALREVLDEK